MVHAVDTHALGGGCFGCVFAWNDPVANTVSSGAERHFEAASDGPRELSSESSPIRTNSSLRGAPVMACSAFANDGYA